MNNILQKVTRFQTRYSSLTCLQNSGATVPKQNDKGHMLSDREGLKKALKCLILAERNGVIPFLGKGSPKNSKSWKNVGSVDASIGAVSSTQLRN